MRLLSGFDSAALPPHGFTADGIRFDLRPGQVILNVLARDLPERLYVDLLVDEKGERFLLGQGLLVSEDGIAFRAVALRKIEDGVLRATIEGAGGELRLASRYPYGRDRLEKLICETSATGCATWRFLQGGHRGLPMAEFGRDDGTCPVHYIIAGEDAWETAGCWVADEMVRELCRNRDLAEAFAGTSLLRIVPLVSPYTATTRSPSYCTLAGDGIYGAATWGDPAPPPEFAVLRALVEHSIRESRLGFLMTMHSWQAQSECTALETIKTAGSHALSEDRASWAAGVMAQMIQGVPQGKVFFPEKIWHAGLARHYLLAEHNVITFRVEVTTAGATPDSFRETGRCFLANLVRIPNWGSVCETTCGDRGMAGHE